jgi:hypothetical protein
LIRHRSISLCILLATPLLGSCFLQPVDSAASSQTSAVQNAPRGPTKVLETPPIELDFDGKRTTTDPCTATREQALEILTTYCAGCHGGRTPAEKHGDFNTILDTSALVMGVSSTVNDPQNPTMKMRLLVPGNPDDSRIYLRVSHGEMPPPAMLGLPPNPTPTISDISVLREWITNCIAPTTAPPATGEGDGGPPTETPPPASPDAGPSVGGKVDAGAPPSSPPDAAPRVDVAPRADAAMPPPGTMSCGLIGQACCATGIACTAPASRCGGVTCEACGAANQLCCANRTCDMGTECVVNNNRGGTCEVCGGRGQRCCGNGAIATMTCQAGLVCALVAQIARCQ